MGLINRLLHSRKTHKCGCSAALEQASDQVHRLEIATAHLRERLDALEGRHASLSASVRGRLGGRPNASTGFGNNAVPLPFNPMIR